MKLEATPPSRDTLDALIRAALDNAASLVAEAEALAARGFWARTHFLASTSLEELSKVRLVADVRAGALPPEELSKALTSHQHKFSYMKENVDPSESPAEQAAHGQFGRAARDLRERSLYAGISESGAVQSPSTEVSEEQARDTLQAAISDLSAVRLLSLSPDGLTSRGARQFAGHLDKGGA